MKGLTLAIRHTGVAGLTFKLCLGLAVLLLSACGVGSIQISGSYPSPLVEKLPLTLGVYYDESFKNHHYTEINDSNGRDEFVVSNGPSQVALFNSLLPAFFEDVVLIDNLDEVPQHPELDLVFVPVIEEFQLGLPHKTRLDIYEVWLKYNMRLSEADGDYIADWVMTAYGKSPSGTFQSQAEGVNDAAIVALRDLAASFTINFRNIPEVNEWLKERSLIK